MEFNSQPNRDRYRFAAWHVSQLLRARAADDGRSQRRCTGAFSGGATEVFAGENHTTMRNFMPELLDSRISFLSGRPKPMNHMAGVDNSFELALLVGYHARAGTLHGVMAHAFYVSVFSLSFNGVEAGEIGTDAALCRFHGVPVGLVAGDRAPCSTATAADFELFVFDGPVSVQVTFVDPSYADTVEHLDSVARLDGRTIRLEAQDYLKAFERFAALCFLAGVVR